MLLLGKLLTIWVQIRDLYLYVFRHAIVLNGYVDDHIWRGIRHRNWGDDLNYYFLQELTGRPVVMYHNFKLAKWFHLKNYLCIGTLLDAVNYSNKQTVVWGAGVSGQDRDFIIPHKMCAVRGYKTIEFLKNRNYPFPTVVGDPALLLPRFYEPKFREERREGRLRGGEQSEGWRGEKELRKYRIGIIPHVIDLKHPVVEEIRNDYPKILIIDLAHYEKWTDVIDQICSCNMILSSSLHGLIVSDAYGIPNCWIELSGKIPAGYFKYQDYGTSVKRELARPFRIENLFDIELAQQQCQRWTKPEINTNALLAVCPFKTKNPKY